MQRLMMIAFRPAQGHSDSGPRVWTCLLLASLVLLACGTPSSGSAGAGAGAAAASATTPAAAPATAANSSAASSSQATTPADPVAAGQTLYVNKGCGACHGEKAEGGIGPALAGTGLSFEAVLQQVRAPKGQMPPFSAQQVSDDELRGIYAYLESLGPPTPTPAPTPKLQPTVAGVASASPAPKPVDVDAIANAVDDLKVASDYAHDAAKTMNDLHTYTGQAMTALQAAQAAVQAGMAAGGGSPELQADLQQLKQVLDATAPEVQAAVAATSVDAAEPHTAKMQLASRLDLLPLAMELLRVNGETGTVTGVVKDTAGKPVADAFVTVEGGKVHTGLLTDGSGAFKASGVAAFRAVEVKAYKAGDLYVEAHARVTKGSSTSVTITIPPESNPPGSPKVSNTTVTGGPVAGTASAHFSMTATQKDNRIAPDQIWALSPQAGVAYVLRSAGNNTYTLDQALPGLKPGSYTWYFFATTHECDMSNVTQQRMTIQ